MIITLAHKQIFLKKHHWTIHMENSTVKAENYLNATTGPTNMASQLVGFFKDLGLVKGKH
jgi:hypothetical protein